jgi:hypothetical protein
VIIIANKGRFRSQRRTAGASPCGPTPRANRAAGPNARDPIALEEKSRQSHSEAASQVMAPFAPIKASLEQWPPLAPEQVPIEA